MLAPVINTVLPSNLASDAQFRVVALMYNLMTESSVRKADSHTIASCTVADCRTNADLKSGHRQESGGCSIKLAYL